MTDPKGRSLKECSKLRTQRNRARAATNAKKGDGKEVHHKKAKGSGSGSYNNSKGNLELLSKSEHVKKKSNGKRGKDTVKRKTTTRKKK